MWSQQEIEELGKMWNNGPEQPTSERWKWRVTLLGGFSYGPIPVGVLVGLFVVFPVLILATYSWITDLL
jgi:hypothetical protein